MIAVVMRKGGRQKLWCKIWKNPHAGKGVGCHHREIGVQVVSRKIRIRKKEKGA